MYPFGLLHFMCDAGLGVIDGGLQVASTHRESNGDIAFHLFAIDERSALGLFDGGELGERYLATGRQWHPDLTDSIETLAILRLPSDHQVETAVALEHLGHGLPADCRLHDCVDVADVEAVAGAFFFSSRRRHTRSVSAFLLNRSSD